MWGQTSETIPTSKKLRSVRESPGDKSITGWSNTHNNTKPPSIYDRGSTEEEVVTCSRDLRIFQVKGHLCLEFEGTIISRQMGSQLLILLKLEI